MKFYPRDPSAALAGMIGLTVEERGAYNTLLDLIYARAPCGDVTDELVIKALAIRPQVWRRLKAGLIAKGKVRETDGKLTANGVETTLISVRKRGGLPIGLEPPDEQNQEVVGGKSKSKSKSKKKEEEEGANAPLSLVPKKYEFESGVIRLTKRDFDQWVEAFPELSLRAELIAITAWAGEQTDWFPAVSGALKNKQQKIIEVRKEAASRPPVKEVKMW